MHRKAYAWPKRLTATSSLFVIWAARAVMSVKFTFYTLLHGLVGSLRGPFHANSTTLSERDATRRRPEIEASLHHLGR